MPTARRPDVTPKITSDPARADHIAEMLKALAHPLRIRIVAFLCQEGECHVNAIAEQLGVKQAILSQQLRILRMRKLVDVARKNGFALYRIAEPQLRTLVRCMEGCTVS